MLTTKYLNINAGLHEENIRLVHTIYNMPTFLLPVVSLSRVSIPPLKETGERVPSTDSSLISLKGEAGTLECKGVEVCEVVGWLPDKLVMVASASEL